MDTQEIIIGSRESTLAVAQSRSLAEYINSSPSGYHAQLLTMKTTGDRILDRTLDQVGGKGLFVRELDIALRERRADLAVHSLKDVPMETDPEIPLLAFSVREDPRDVLVLPLGKRDNCDQCKVLAGTGTGEKDRLSSSVNEDTRLLNDARSILPPGAVIGSSSYRRRLQLEKLFPGREIRPVRGNVLTRLRKLDEGQYDALILAAAGLKRLGLQHRISYYFSTDEMLPAAGQGILAVQGRSGEDHSYLAGFHNPDAAAAAVCERAFVRTLEGGCSSPVCAYAQVRGETITVKGLYYREGMEDYRIGGASGPAVQAERIGRELALQMCLE